MTVATQELAITPANTENQRSTAELELMRALLGTVPEELAPSVNSAVTEQHSATLPGELYQVSELSDRLVIDWHTAERGAEVSREESAAAGAGIVAMRSETTKPGGTEQEVTLRGSIDSLVQSLARDPSIHGMTYTEVGKAIQRSYATLPRSVKKGWRNDVALETGDRNPIDRRLSAYFAYHDLTRRVLAATLETRFDNAAERAQSFEGAIVLRGETSIVSIRAGEFESKLGYKHESEAHTALNATKGLAPEGLKIENATDANEQPVTSVAVSPKELVAQLLAESSDHEAFLDRALPSLLGVQEAQRQIHRAQELLDEAKKRGLPDTHDQVVSINDDLSDAQASVVRESLAVFDVWRSQEAGAVQAELRAALAGIEAQTMSVRGGTDANAYDQITLQRAAFENQLKQCFGADGGKNPSAAELLIAKQQLRAHAEAS